MKPTLEAEKRTARLSIVLTPTRAQGLRQLASLLGLSVNDLINDIVERTLVANTAIIEEGKKIHSSAMKDFAEKKF